EDTSFFPRGIWDPEDRSRHTFSTEGLDRYDYLIAQLIRHGIYVNVNLHVGRSPDESDPCPEAAKLTKYGKGVDNFWPPLIEFQKRFAKALLGRVNPYLGHAYAEEPGLAFVEINNENSLIDVWSQGAIDQLPDPYTKYLDERWNEWLKNRYGNTDKLRGAWAQGEEPLGDEMLANGDLSQGMTDWGVQQIEPCKMESSITNEGPGGRPCLTVHVTATDAVAWHGQVHYRNIGVDSGKAYTVSVWLRAEPARQVAVNVMRDHEPWSNLGLATRVDVGPDWKQYTFGFRATDTDDKARISVSNLALQEGAVQIADLSLRPGGIIGLPEGEALENGSVSRIRLGDMARRTAAAAADQALFYLQLERQYWQTMYDYLKKELGLRAMVTGTQVTYSPVYTQEMMDYFDAHAYWQHPG
ncbi:MAG: carbohydrate binding domain-containing protein, partial [Armatimonadetes bacterium]|nr:carbohydrate binding domain-containing protein [Armatimonadota bacterium]